MSVAIVQNTLSGKSLFGGWRDGNVSRAQFRSEARMSNPENVFGIYYDTKCIFWVEHSHLSKNLSDNMIL